MRVIDLGRLTFAEALAIQEAAVEEVREGGEERLYVLEHHPVITFGRHGGEAFLLASAPELARRGVEVAKATRGGSVTCHFPGQAVLYPILRLSGRPGGLRAHFEDLEQAAMDVLAAMGVPSGRSEGRPGVWCGPRKIASVGVGVRRWVSYHGIAFNVEPDVSLFSLTTPCGLAGVEMTSAWAELARLGLDTAPAEVQGVKHALAHAFARAVLARREA
ncbi:Octanoyltransferase [Fundidesulfovibrio magnetotacticus]|uniref:Octanoyltransferase n=1 Tax=Fundidesulfovibrio magnetotacticus TaxID=2730080 RepID=A0A6V8LXP9_9BACT|nr:lipoyl(octanoyl) transferase LipB [Fundidesulfovibrio magnetotacticus]GFK95028.1 Octanoyltransferase [Fundidesulfovibrio magnetotacticus]